MFSSKQIQIPDTEKEYIGGKEVTFYKINVVYNKTKNWSLRRRYNEFHDFAKELAKNIADCPVIPNKSYVSYFVNTVSIEDRRKKLHKFLVECASRLDIIRNPDFQDFIELQKGDFKSDVQEKKLISIDGLPMGVRDLILFKDNEYLLMALGEMFIGNRINSYLNNQFEDYNKEAVGYVVLFQKKNDVYEEINNLKFECQVAL